MKGQYRFAILKSQASWNRNVCLVGIVWVFILGIFIILTLPPRFELCLLAVGIIENKNYKSINLGLNSLQNKWNWNPSDEIKISFEDE